MRLIVIIVLVALAIWAIVAGLVSKKRTSRGRVSWLLVFALLIPAGVLGWFEYTWQTDIAAISKNVVQKISGRAGSELDCQRLTVAYIDVWASEKTFDAGSNKAGLKYADCERILNYYRQDIKATPSVDDVKAFHLLSTESTRLAGKTKNVGTLNCLGAVNIPIVVEGLGGTKDQGVYAYRLFKQEVMDKDTKFREYGC